MLKYVDMILIVRLRHGTPGIEQMHTMTRNLKAHE